MSVNRSVRHPATLIVLFALAASSVMTVHPAHAEVAVAPEKNPPGDIPDTQAFIDYRSDLGYELQVPEGWARSETADGVLFVDKLDGVAVVVTNEAKAPTVEWAKSTYIKTLEKSARAMTVTEVAIVPVKGGKAIRIAYSSNSEPNAVTSKQIRLENDRYLFWKDGRLAALELYAPLGADNVDQWQLMSNSFRWR